MLESHGFRGLILFYTHLLLLLQPSVLWLFIATFNDAKPLARRVTPPWNVYIEKFDPGWKGYPVWQTGLPALAGDPTYNVNVFNLKRKTIWTGGSPHLPRVRHLNVLYRHECFPGKYTTRKIHKNYIRNPSGLFSIISHVSLSIT